MHGENFKLLNQIADLMAGKLPEFAETDLCTHIMDRGYTKALNPPKPPTELVCPICGDSYGYPVKDPSGLWWACRNKKCIDINNREQEFWKKPAHLRGKSETRCDSLPPKYLEATFKDYYHGKETIQTIAKWFYGKHPFLILSGKNGRGKTYTACAILNESLKNKNTSAFFQNISDLSLNYLYEKGTGDFARRIEKLCTPTVLVLDDMGQRTPTEAFLDALYIVINRRSDPQKKTIITTNLNANEFPEKFGDAIMSRIVDGIQIKMVGEDQRKV